MSLRCSSASDSVAYGPAVCSPNPATEYSTTYSFSLSSIRLSSSVELVSMVLDIHRRRASKIVSGLWQGGFPVEPRRVGESGFKLIVLTARELQPESSDEAAATFPGVEVVLAPMDDEDSGPTDEEARLAARAATRVAEALRQGYSVLVTCNQGRNRSGLVTALALVMRHGIDGGRAASIVRARRAGALTNAGFSAFLERVSGR